MSSHATHQFVKRRFLTVFLGLSSTRRSVSKGRPWRVPGVAVLWCTVGLQGAACAGGPGLVPWCAAVLQVRNPPSWSKPDVTPFATRWHRTPPLVAKKQPTGMPGWHGKGDCRGLQGKLQAQAWAFSGLICFIFDSRLRLFQKRWWRFLCPNSECIAGRPLGGVTCACARGAVRSGPGPAEPGLCSRAAGVKCLEVAALLGVFDAAKPVGAAEGGPVERAAGF